MYWIVAAAILLPVLILLGMPTAHRKALKKLQSLAENGSDSRHPKRLINERVRSALLKTSAAFGNLLPPETVRRLSFPAKRYTSVRVDEKTFAGARVTCAVASSLLTLALSRFSHSGLAVSLMAGALGSALPIMHLRKSDIARKELIMRSLPRACDLLYSYVLGGKNLDQAFRLTVSAVGEPLAQVLSQALREIDLGSPRKEAFERADRQCGVPELSFLLRLLEESEKRGYSLSSTLNVLSRELRAKRASEIKRKAAVMPLKMLFPLVFLILPSSVLLTVGPVFLFFAQKKF